jgi:drug/metabolite transporter (DMT)-like permease
VLSAILARAFLGEPTTRRNVSGIVLCVFGAFLIGTAGPDLSASEANLDKDTVAKLLMRPPFVVFMLVTLVSTAALMAVGLFTSLGDDFLVVHIGVSSLLGGITVVCAKALSTFLRLTIEGESQFGNWLPFALVVALGAAISTQLLFLNRAMARFGNSQVVPVYYVLFTICAMTSGAIMYKGASLARRAAGGGRRPCLRASRRPGRPVPTFHALTASPLPLRPQSLTSCGRTTCHFLSALRRR